ncbi:hypothetical protein Tph_c01090 [Thermacetogenium phaeum DSM 12270]|uniref:Uncharacterized protein n=1 Tax=Thermacetogenium phaeum (strain ATCC BAA-254 / DSM 26808 / PB) TaxID=1089553 RepID=K4LE61_THEPS|nr:hypothetical protein Tph_c01090 [Thermacetogenium phaeum DSM 12270]
MVFGDICLPAFSCSNKPPDGVFSAEGADGLNLSQTDFVIFEIYLQVVSLPDIQLFSYRYG